jgi:hypothetical protein
MPTVVSTDGPKRGRRAQERGRPAARARDAGEYRARLAILPGRPDRSHEIYRHVSTGRIGPCDAMDEGSTYHLVLQSAFPNVIPNERSKGCGGD